MQNGLEVPQKGIKSKVLFVTTTVVQTIGPKCIALPNNWLSLPVIPEG